MPTPAELDDFDDQFNDLRTLLVAALVEQWASDVAPSPAEARERLQEVLLDLLDEYGPAAASIAADFYDSVRPGGAPPFVAEAIVSDDLLLPGTLNWVTEPLLTEDWQKALDRAAAAVQKSTKQALVDTIGENTALDPLDVRFARWPQNSDPCAYCVMRASRGAVYWTEATAERGDHLKCGCRVTPVFTGERLPYLTKPYMAQYLAGADEAAADIGAAAPGKAKRRALLSGMRRANGSR